MGKLFKILFITIVALVLLIVIAAITVPLFVNPNDFKPQIVELVKKQTGRDLMINGDLEISVFPWIGLSTGELILSDAKGFKQRPFAKVEESNIKVKVLPLLAKKVEVSRIVLKGLDLYLAKNKKGVTNWQDLMANNEKPEKATSSSTTTEPASSAPLAALAVGGISIEQAHIVWDDQQTGDYTEVNDFNLTTDQLVFNQPVDVALSLVVKDKKAKTQTSIDLSTQLTVNEAIDQIKLTALTLKTQVQGEKTLKAELRSSIALDLKQQQMAITDLTLKSGQLNVTGHLKGEHITEKPVFSGQISVADFNLGTFLRDMGVRLNMRDKQALSHFSLTSNLSATDHSARFSNLALKLDDSTMNGNVSILNFKQQAIRFDLRLDHIDADRYLPPEDKTSSKSKAAASPAAVAAASAALFPVETLRKLNMQGTLVIDSLVLHKIAMRGISLKIDAKGGVLNTRQTIKHLLQGRYSGQTTINAKHKTPVLALNETLSNVQVGPLLKAFNGSDRMTGRINAKIRLKGAGNTTRAIKSSLNGSIRFDLTETVIKGFNIQKLIDSVKTLLKGSPLPVENKNDQTLFSKIGGTAVVTRGVLHNDDLVALSSRVNVTGKGLVNLRTDQIDYKIRAAVTKRGQADAVKGIPLVVRITGPLAKPRYVLDVAAMALEKNKEKIDKVKNKLLQKLDKKLGPGAAGAAGELLKSFF